MPAVALQAQAPEAYLGADEIVESGAPAVVALGRELRRENPDDHAFARAAFEWVRDEVAHAYDAQDHRVTLAASDVLRERVGLCYAKANLLTAVLRSQHVPAGLCYQRLGSPDEGYFVHGLVAVYLDGAWHRQDPRGNKQGIDAQFSTAGERLAWTADEARGECDYATLHTTVAPEVRAALDAATDVLGCPLPAELATR